MYRQEIEAYFEARREEIVRQIARLIPFRSVREAPLPDAPYGVACRDVLLEAAEMAREMGFAVKNFGNQVISVADKYALRVAGGKLLAAAGRARPTS